MSGTTPTEEQRRRPHRIVLTQQGDRRWVYEVYAGNSRRVDFSEPRAYRTKRWAAAKVKRKWPNHTVVEVPLSKA